MPRRRAISREQVEELLAWPAVEPVRHWTLGAADLAALESRRGDPRPARFRAAALCFALSGPLSWSRDKVEGYLGYFRNGLVGQGRRAFEQLAPVGAQPVIFPAGNLRAAGGAKLARRVIL